MCTFCYIQQHLSGSVRKLIPLEGLLTRRQARKYNMPNIHGREPSKGSRGVMAGIPLSISATTTIKRIIRRQEFSERSQVSFSSWLHSTEFNLCGRWMQLQFPQAIRPPLMEFVASLKTLNRKVDHSHRASYSTSSKLSRWKRKAASVPASSSLETLLSTVKSYDDLSTSKISRFTASTTALLHVSLLTTLKLD